MDKLEKLTPEQEKLMYEVRDEYIALFNSIKRIDEPTFEKGIEWVYNDLLELPTPIIVYCESWYDALRKIACQQIKDLDNIEPLDEYHNIKENLQSRVDQLIKDSFNDFSNYTNSYSNFGWVAFYDFFDRIGILNDDKFPKYKMLIKSGAFQVYEYDTHVFAIQPAQNMTKNAMGQLNNIDGKSFEWSDGSGFYYINGFNISQSLFKELIENTYTPEQFFKEQNEEIKSAVVSFLQQKGGDEAIYRFFENNLKLVDTFVDEKEEQYMEGTTKGMNIGVYSLFKGNINDFDIAYVRCYCPSTDRMFFLGVEPNQTNAKDAIASLYQVPSVLENNIVSISRQGEKFSTIFDEQTTNKLRNNEFDKTTLRKYTSISGDRYFKLMKYEF